MTTPTDRKIAVIGSGASAAGVANGLEASGVDAEITIFSSDRYFSSLPRSRYEPAGIEQFYDAVYADIRRTAVNYPPRKTFFADPVPCHLVDGEARFFRTEMFGGQTNIWGGTVLPLAREDFAGWPISREELEPHYRAIADSIGIAGQPDRVSEFLGLDYSNAPAVKQLEGFRCLQDHLAAHPETDDYRIYAGVAPSAVETRSGAATSCVECGECMVGCARDSIYSARNALKRSIDRGEIRFVPSDVRSIRMDRGNPEVCSVDGHAERFDRVFLASGCVATTEILMRSLNLSAGPVLQDNSIAQFPILNLSRHSDRRRGDYFGLTNLLLLMAPTSSRASLLQVQLYPNVDYLWRTLAPAWSWKLVRHPVRWLRDRLIWARAYLDAAASHQYFVTLENDRIAFAEKNSPDKAAISRCVSSLRQALRGSAFFLLPFAPVVAHTSAHLAGTFPYGAGSTPVARDGEVMPGVHIADSSCFPTSPVISPTLTIMANARRTALEALRK
ncbi:MAG: GMC family oxidoreductase [Deltaproteobacteria bacterium]|jgi:choline dehydrogenase-like flavoprotein|nr:GMC family oxidoreductase [Deltaproteobacteria bacterium]